MHVLRWRTSAGNDAAEMPAMPAPSDRLVPRGAGRATGAFHPTISARFTPREWIREAARGRFAAFRAASATGGSARATSGSGPVAASRGCDSLGGIARFATRRSPGHSAFRAGFARKSGAKRGIAHLANSSARGQETGGAAGRLRTDTAKCDSRTAPSATNVPARVAPTGNPRDNAFLIQTTCVGGSPVVAIKTSGAHDGAAAAIKTRRGASATRPQAQVASGGCPPAAVPLGVPAGATLRG
jgi:hypothetical protein